MKNIIALAFCLLMSYAYPDNFIFNGKPCDDEFSKYMYYVSGAAQSGFKIKKGVVITTLHGYIILKPENSILSQKRDEYNMNYFDIEKYKIFGYKENGEMEVFETNCLDSIVNISALAKEKQLVSFADLVIVYFEDEKEVEEYDIIEVKSKKNMQDAKIFMSGFYDKNVFFSAMKTPLCGEEDYSVLSDVTTNKHKFVEFEEKDLKKDSLYSDYFNYLADRIKEVNKNCPYAFFLKEDLPFGYHGDSGGPIFVKRAFDNKYKLVALISAHIGIDLDNKRVFKQLFTPLHPFKEHFESEKPE